MPIRPFSGLQRRAPQRRQAGMLVMAPVAEMRAGLRQFEDAPAHALGEAEIVGAENDAVRHAESQ